MPTHLEKSHAAVHIQRICRGFLARRRIRILNGAALIVQRHVRGHLARVRYQRQIYHAQTIAKHDKSLAKTRERVVAREKELRELKGIRAQRVNEFEVIRRVRAAIIIQCAVRCFLAIKVVDKMRSDVKRRNKQKKQQQQHNLNKLRKERDERKRLTSSREVDEGLDNSDGDSDVEDKRTDPLDTASLSASGLPVTSSNKERRSTATTTTKKISSPHTRLKWTDLVAVASDGDVVAARDIVVKKLRDRRRRFLLDEEEDDSISIRHGSVGSAARLLSGLVDGKTLLDKYYDNVDIAECSIRTGYLKRLWRGNAKAETVYDVSLGCKALRLTFGR